MKKSKDETKHDVFESFKIMPRGHSWFEPMDGGRRSNEKLSAVDVFAIILLIGVVFIIITTKH